MFDRQMAFDFVGGAQLQRGDQFAVIFQVPAGHHPRAILIPPASRVGTEYTVKGVVSCGDRYARKLSNSGDQNGLLGRFGCSTR